MSAATPTLPHWADFTNDFELHAKWRRDYAQRLQVLSDWLRTHDLVDDAVQDRLDTVERQLRRDKVTVAFVAEFSRGKSELINAIFFAAYGKRIMPASAGRTTMCPTELGWDASVPPCLRLLPIETRLEPQALLEWRNAPETWQQLDLDVSDPDQLAAAIEKVAELTAVNQEQARALGFWHDNTPDDNPPVNADGLVEVPRWRHALINIAHPLLQQGLVVLDTPGLNAIGAEPELTVSLLPQADAVLFILGADTGVTKSDLEIWQEHLAVRESAAAAHLVVLNKIDGLWDALSSPEQIAQTIAKQCADSARILGLQAKQVLPVSAQKGLLAKVQGDAHLLAQSRLPALEQALSEAILGRRHDILQAQVLDGLRSVREAVRRRLRMQERERNEQIAELSGLRGKNATVVRRMRSRILHEQDEFNQSGVRIHALKSVHMQMLGKLFEALSSARVLQELELLAEGLQQTGLKLGVKKLYGETFERLSGFLQQADAINQDLFQLLAGSFNKINTEHGFALQLQAMPSLTPYHQQLAQIQAGHVSYLGVNNLLRLNQADFTSRLMKSLSIRLRSIFDHALAEVEQWNKDAAAQLDAQVRERRRSFGKRLDAIESIQHAVGSLEDRLQEIEHSVIEDERLLHTLEALIAKLLDAQEVNPLADITQRRALVTD